MFFNCFGFVSLIVVVVQDINLDSSSFCGIRWENFFHGWGVAVSKGADPCGCGKEFLIP